MITDEMIEAGCKARHGRAWARHAAKPDMEAWAASHRAEMKMILAAALKFTPPVITAEEIRREIEDLRARHRGLTAHVSGSARAMAQQSMMVCDDLERRLLKEKPISKLSDGLVEALKACGVDE